MQVCAEANAIELRVVFKGVKNRAKQVSNIIVESKRREAIARSGGGLWQSRVDGNFQIRAATKRNEVRCGVGDEVRLGIEFLHHAVENRLESGLQSGERLRGRIARRQ